MNFNITLRKFVLLLVSGVFDTSASASEPGTWFMLFNQTRIHNQWSIHAEAQFRSYTLNPSPGQILLRAGMNYHYNPTTVFSAGYGYISNPQMEGGLKYAEPVVEHRSWEQLSLRNNVGRVYLEHRYRLEQRWIHASNAVNYRDRIRYLLRATVPVNNAEMKKNTFFLTFYDEVFLHFSSSPYDRNRAYAAAGYQLNASTNVQLGYLVQSTAKSYQYFQVLVIFNPDLRKTE